MGLAQHGDHAPAHGTAADHGRAKGKAAESSLTSVDAVSRLTAGNARFASGKLTHPDLSPERRELTATEGQKPFATILSCSDSRVPPELIFDQGVGSVFSIRVAGNVADTDEMGSIEYGVDHLGTPLLVVLGHTKCGAVTAVATGASVHGHIPELVDNIKEPVEETKKKHPNEKPEEIIPDAIKANVFHSIADLLTKSSMVRERAKAGKVQVVGAVYDITSGKVEWLGKHPDETSLMAEGEKQAASEKHGAADAGEKHGGGTEANAHASGSASAVGSAHGVEGDEKGGQKSAPGNLPAAFALVAFLAALGGGLTGVLWAKSQAKSKQEE